MKCIDFGRTCRALYTATAKVKEVEADRAVYLARDGKGPPGGTSFRSAIQELYGMAYTIKFALRHGRRGDFVVSKLECLYLNDPRTTPKEQWAWRLLVRVPESVTAADVAGAARSLGEKKGIDASGVRRISWAEGPAVQTLHVGPYDRLGESYARLEEFARQIGLTPTGPAHEIYLSDPRRVPPERLKTIARLPMKR